MYNFINLKDERKKARKIENIVKRMLKEVNELETYRDTPADFSEFSVFIYDSEGKYLKTLYLIVDVDEWSDGEGGYIQNYTVTDYYFE